jgi:IS4 transposase
VIADRGYESYNNFAHIERKGWNHVIRVKDLASSGILSGLRLPASNSFDKEVHLTLTKKQTKEVKAHPENLSADDFSPNELKSIYNMRWGIETSFRALKYTIGLTNFHAKRRESVIQEIFARMIMYNFAEMMTSHIVISQMDKRHQYQVNFTVAVHVCRHFLRSSDDEPPLTLKH